MNNRWVRAAIPGLLLHCSIGTVYCWSVFSADISNYIGWSKSAVGWAFSFAIFFLGMSAAFLGNIVEKDIHKSSLIATICFTVGMVGTGFFIWYGGQHRHSIVALLGIYISYGAVMGVGLGTGYLSPVKTLMLWFEDRKGLATGLAVAGFGLAKALASPVMTKLLTAFGTTDVTCIAGDVKEVGTVLTVNNGTPWMFMILAVAYFIMMFVGHLLLKKPSTWHEPAAGEKKPGIWATLKTRPYSNYLGIWLMFYINITCGLAIISQEKPIVSCLGFSAVAAGYISTVSAIFNAGGRLGFSAWADKLKDRNTIYKLIFVLSSGCTVLVLATNGIKNGNGNTLLTVLVLALIFIVNAGYGGGFSNVPTLLSDHYGMGSISAIHGITLSAWAFAGLSGNQMANFIVTHFGDTDAEYNAVGYQYVLYVTGVLYVVALLLSLFLVKKSGKAAKAES